jgi:hypothetical protein
MSWPNNTRGVSKSATARNGLSDEQRARVDALLPGAIPGKMGTQAREGWSIFRSPTTVNPPTTLRLHKRNRSGRLVTVISITENGKMV